MLSMKYLYCYIDNTSIVLGIAAAMLEISPLEGFYGKPVSLGSSADFAG